MARGHDAGADDHRAPLAEPAIRDDSSKNRCDVGHAHVGPIDQRRLFLADQQLLGHVVDQQGAHAVVGENLPHLGQKKYGEAARLTEPSLLARVHASGALSARPAPHLLAAPRVAIGVRHAGRAVLGQEDRTVQIHHIAELSEHERRRHGETGAHHVAHHDPQP